MMQMLHFIRTQCESSISATLVAATAASVFEVSKAICTCTDEGEVKREIRGCTKIQHSHLHTLHPPREERLELFSLH